MYDPLLRPYLTILPIFPSVVDPRAIAHMEHHDEVAEMLDAPRHGTNMRGVSTTQNPLQKIITRGETRGMATALHGDFIFRLLDHVLEAFLEEGPNPD